MCWPRHCVAIKTSSHPLSSLSQQPRPQPSITVDHRRRGWVTRTQWQGHLHWATSARTHRRATQDNIILLLCVPSLLCHLVESDVNAISSTIRVSWENHPLGQVSIKRCRLIWVRQYSYTLSSVGLPKTTPLSRNNMNVTLYICISAKRIQPKQRIITLKLWNPPGYWLYRYFMMTSSNWKHFSRYWPFVRGIHWSPVISPHKGQWRGALMFSLICAWINGALNNGEAGDLRRHRAHYDVTVMSEGNNYIGVAMMTPWNVKAFHIDYWFFVRIPHKRDSNMVVFSLFLAQSSSWTKSQVFCHLTPLKWKWHIYIWSFQGRGPDGVVLCVNLA